MIARRNNPARALRQSGGEQLIQLWVQAFPKGGERGAEYRTLARHTARGRILFDAPAGLKGCGAPDSLTHLICARRLCAFRSPRSNWVPDSNRLIGGVVPVTRLRPSANIRESWPPGGPRLPVVAIRARAERLPTLRLPRRQTRPLRAFAPRLSQSLRQSAEAPRQEVMHGNIRVSAQRTAATTV